jgi:hypothetical protein
MAGGPPIIIKASGLRAARKLTSGANRAIDKALLNTTEAGARKVEKHLKLVKFSGKPIKVRTGRTRASIHTRLYPRERKAVVGSKMVQMRILEEGGTITPTRAKVLTIPLRAALTASGASRGTAREVGRRYWDTWWDVNDRGNLILYGIKDAEGAEPVPLFVGVTKVTIKGRHAFEKTAKKFRPTIQKDFRIALDEELEVLKRRGR